jgi:hypothetical protein
LCTITSIRPQRSSTVATAAPSEAWSSRSAGTARAFCPSFSISAAVSDKLPGNGVTSVALIVEECSRCSPALTVRAVTATS